MTEKDTITNQNKEENEVEESGDKPSIPLRWVLYVILGYAVLQTIFICYQIYSTDVP